MNYIIQKVLGKIGNICYCKALDHGLKQNHRREYLYFRAYAMAFDVRDIGR